MFGEQSGKAFPTVVMIGKKRCSWRMAALPAARSHGDWLADKAVNTSLAAYLMSTHYGTGAVVAKSFHPEQPVEQRS